MTLCTVLENHYEHLAELAESWLATGALSFELWSDETCLARWGNGESPHGQVVIELVKVHHMIFGELRVVSHHFDDQARRRLSAESRLIGRLVQCESEQESLITELIETQDQLLAMYDLTKSECYHIFYQDIEQLLRCLVREMSRLLNTEGGFMLLNGCGPIQMACYPPGFEETSAACFSHIQTMGASEEVLLNSDSGVADLPLGVYNLLYVPIAIQSGVTMGLGLVNKPGGLASPDLKLMRSVSEQAAARIENFLLHQETLKQATWQTEMQMAREVQFRLLPQHVPDICGLSLYAGWRPARQTSGDFYDFVERPDHPFLFAVGDVSGKGMPAALLTIEIITEIRSQARILLDTTPSTMMYCINESLYNHLTQTEMLATLFIAQYDPSCRMLQYANAGHAPVIYCPSDGMPRLITATDPPIGVLPNINFQHHSLTFSPGDVLVVATDGFHESFNAAGHMLGYHRMMDLVGMARIHAADEIARLLFEQVDHFVGRTEEHHPLDDDQTIIVVKGTDVGAETHLAKRKMIHLDLPAAPQYLEILESSIASLFDQDDDTSSTEKVMYEIHLALYELCANIIEHAYVGHRGYISINLTRLSYPSYFIVETMDTGVSFDPVIVKEPSLLDERGRGLYLIRKSMNEIQYHTQINQAWQSIDGESWHMIHAAHPQPGRNYWRLVKYV